MIRQSSSAGLCKCLHNEDKKLCTFFVKERQKVKAYIKNQNQEAFIVIIIN